ncbi:hypothetical protein [Daejeonella lutea]|uniref:Uncharacterized protein n=1 Tax=Daejeonella lutea TaxID=572036 RepID=A0A1T5D2K5_9SPHI|nr:hypothetical protein [Daejeonella lutea]SKB65934.1 hypothetical protein SAMN05661099_2135 [Daejeonella lutea]
METNQETGLKYERANKSDRYPRGSNSGSSPTSRIWYNVKIRLLNVWNERKYAL